MKLYSRSSKQWIKRVLSNFPIRAKIMALTTRIVYLKRQIGEKYSLHEIGLLFLTFINHIISVI